MVRDVRKRGNVRHLHHGIGRRFGIDQTCIRKNVRTHVLDVSDVRRVKGDAEMFPKFVYLAVRAAVYIIGNNHMVAAFEQGKHRKHGGKSRGKGKAGAAALQEGNCVLQAGARRVVAARIGIAYVRAERGIDKGRGLINGAGDRAVQRVGRRIPVNRFGGNRKIGKTMRIDHGAANPFRKNMPRRYKVFLRMYECLHGVRKCLYEYVAFRGRVVSRKA